MVNTANPSSNGQVANTASQEAVNDAAFKKEINDEARKAVRNRLLKDTMGEPDAPKPQTSDTPKQAAPNDAAPKSLEKFSKAKFPSVLPVRLAQAETVSSDVAAAGSRLRAPTDAEKKIINDAKAGTRNGSSSSRGINLLFEDSGVYQIYAGGTGSKFFKLDPDPNAGKPTNSLGHKYDTVSLSGTTKQPIKLGDGLTIPSGVKFSTNKSDTYGLRFELKTGNLEIKPFADVRSGGSAYTVSFTPNQGVNKGKEITAFIDAGAMMMRGDKLIVYGAKAGSLTDMLTAGSNDPKEGQKIINQIAGK